MESKSIIITNVLIPPGCDVIDSIVNYLNMVSELPEFTASQMTQLFQYPENSLVNDSDNDFDMSTMLQIPSNKISQKRKLEPKIPYEKKRKRSSREHQQLGIVSIQKVLRVPNSTPSSVSTTMPGAPTKTPKSVPHSPAVIPPPQ